MKKYSLNYEGGKCPFGYEYVSAHRQGEIWIDSYCRKLVKHGFFGDPDSKDQKIGQKNNAEAMKVLRMHIGLHAENVGSERRSTVSCGCTAWRFELIVSISLLLYKLPETTSGMI